MRQLLSIIVPCYNEEHSIELFFNETEKYKLTIDREYIFIDDGSTDDTLKEMQKLHNKYPEKVKYYSFSRNFGKEAAIYAGLTRAQGDYVTLMDADLQDPPSLLPKMYQILTESDYDCVGTRRMTRQGEPFIRSVLSKSFYKLINKISDYEIIDGVRDYRMMKRHMVDSVLELTEYNRFSKGIFAWVGYKTKYLEYPNIERAAGETSWSFWGLVKYSIEGFVSSSEVPLDIASYLGIITFIGAIILAIIFFFRTFFFGNPTPGWTSLIVVILVLGSIQLLSIGILGKYLGKTFLETKRRPHFFIRETSEEESDKIG